MPDDLDAFLLANAPRNECFMCTQVDPKLRAQVEESVTKLLNTKPRRIVPWTALTRWMSEHGARPKVYQVKRHFESGHHERT